jgi:hypothetical protein
VRTGQTCRRPLSGSGLSGSLKTARAGSAATNHTLAWWMQ